MKTHKKRCNRRRTKRRGGTKTHKCCICEKKTDKNGLETTRCRVTGNYYRHKICQECWWNPEKGFALESANHKCHGCEKGWSPKKKSPKSPKPTIDLTGDSP